MLGRSDSRKGAAAFLPVLLLCLFARALVPAGWMPSYTAQGIALIPCTGVVTALTAHAGHHAAGHDHSDEAKHDVSGQPCSFAATAVDLPGPTGSAAAPVLPRTTDLFRATASVSIGRGLAAPPPPATGPPLTA